MSFFKPKKGVVYWPVGTGDSSTIFIGEKTIQVDLHNLGKAEDENTPHWEIVKELESFLPKKNKRPFLDVFILTHPDLDHIKGFQELLSRVDIGELWFTPRIFTEYKKELSDDAHKFREEAIRRVKECKNGNNVKEGDRIKVFGFSEILKKDIYKDILTEKMLTIPGQEISTFNGNDLSDELSIFIHSPFKESLEGDDRNDTSLGFQVTLTEGTEEGRFLFFGDLKYDSIMKIFDINKDDIHLRWDVLLAPHHCSKKVMYVREDEKDKLQQDIMDNFEKLKMNDPFVISSSEKFRVNDKNGDNPPHIKAKNRYLTLLEDETHFICTHEHSDKEKPEPIQFVVDINGFSYSGPRKRKMENVDLKKNIAVLTGEGSGHSHQVGHGK